MNSVVVIPVKDFGLAKGRLADHVSSGDRAKLAEQMAVLVAHAAAPLPVFVVCDTDRVADWAWGIGARVMWRQGLGLNAAVSTAVEELIDSGVDRAIVTHSDLPLAYDLGRLARPSADTVLVPDRHGDGTNIAVVSSRFNFSYGAGSFGIHRQRALDLGHRLTVVHDARLSWDVDRVDDLNHPLVRQEFPWLQTSPASQP